MGQFLVEQATSEAPSSAIASSSPCSILHHFALRAIPAGDQREGAESPWVAKGVADLAREQAFGVACSCQEGWVGEGEEERFKVGPGHHAFRRGRDEYVEAGGGYSSCFFNVDEVY